VLGEAKVILAKAGNGLSLFVCDNHVHHNDATFDFDGRALTRRGQGRSLRAGLRETESCEKEEGGRGEKRASHCKSTESLSQRTRTGNRPQAAKVREDATSRILYIAEYMAPS